MPRRLWLLDQAVNGYFSANLGREVPVEVEGRIGRAVLKVKTGRAKERAYYFQVSWDSPASAEPPPKKSDKVGKSRSRRLQAGESGAAAPEPLAKGPAKSNETSPIKTDVSREMAPDRPNLKPVKSPKGKSPKAKGGGNGEPWG